MADNLPDPESRVESYLAKAAGEDVTIPEKPLSRLEQYLDAIAEGGGGGGTSDFDQLSNRPKYNGTAMTGETNIPASPTVVQTTGTSETDVMSQNAASSLIYKDPATKKKMAIGDGTTVSTTASRYCMSIGYGAESKGDGSVALGHEARAKQSGDIAIGNTAYTSAYNNLGNVISIGTGAGDLNQSSTDYSISIGNICAARSQHSIAMGHNTYTSSNAPSSIAIGYGAYATQKGEFNIGTSGTNGYNNSIYRLITGVHDGSSDHDAATYGQVNTRLGGMTLVSISQTDYDNLSTKDPNTLYVITGA